MAGALKQQVALFLIAFTWIIWNEFSILNNKTVCVAPSNTQETLQQMTITYHCQTQGKSTPYAEFPWTPKGHIYSTPIFLLVCQRYTYFPFERVKHQYTNEKNECTQVSSLSPKYKKYNVAWRCLNNFDTIRDYNDSV